MTLARRTRVIAVVGSFGKSTTMRAVATALGVPLRRTTLANSWGSIALAILRVPPLRGHSVIEVGIARPGEMEQYAAVVRPDVTIVTSVGSDHNRSLQSLETTRAEKSRMVRALDRSGTAVLNGDDANVMWMKGETEARVVTFGFGDACDVRAEALHLDWPRGMRFRLKAFGQERTVNVRLVGRQMVYPMLAAVAVSHIENRSLDEALTRLSSLAPTPGRMDPVSLPGGVVVLRDDYKSSLETIEAALDALGEIPASRRVVVLGDVEEPVGSQGPIQIALGGRVARVASQLIVVSSSPKNRYSAGAQRAGMPKHAIIDAEGSPRRAAEALRAVVQPGDVVLIKGRDVQKLDRVRLMLEERPVKCEIRVCRVSAVDCEHCPMLERGWEGHPVIT